MVEHLLCKQGVIGSNPIVSITGVGLQTSGIGLDCLRFGVWCLRFVLWASSSVG